MERASLKIFQEELVGDREVEGKDQVEEMTKAQEVNDGGDKDGKGEEASDEGAVIDHHLIQANQIARLIANSDNRDERAT